MQGGGALRERSKRRGGAPPTHAGGRLPRRRSARARGAGVGPTRHGGRAGSARLVGRFRTGVHAARDLHAVLGDDLVEHLRDLAKDGDLCELHDPAEANCIVQLTDAIEALDDGPVALDDVDRRLREAQRPAERVTGRSRGGGRSARQVERNVQPDT